MFTELVRISCDFPACHGGSAKYQTCLIFHQPSLILDPDLSYTFTILSGNNCPSDVFKYPGPE